MKPVQYMKGENFTENRGETRPHPIETVPLNRNGACGRAAACETDRKETVCTLMSPVSISSTITVVFRVLFLVSLI